MFNSKEVSNEAGYVPATVSFYSDAHVYDIISRTNKTMTLRKRNAICVKSPKMIPGGFAGVVVEPAEWKTESNPEGPIYKASLRKNGRWILTGYSGKDGSGVVYPGLDRYHYDYGF